MMVDKEKVSQLGKKAGDMLKTLEQNLTKDEKLYLITTMAKKTLQENN